MSVCFEMELCWMQSAADSSGILAEQQGDVAAAVMNGSVLGSAVDQSLLHVTTVGERACVFVHAWCTEMS